MKFSVVFPFALAAALSASAQTPAKPAAATKPRPAAAKSSAPSSSSTAPAAPKSAPASAAAKSASASTAAAGPASKPVMTVGTEQISEAEFDALIEALPEQYRAQARGPMKRQMAEQIARVKLLAAEARKRGLDKEKVTQSKIRFQEENLLAGATYADFAQKAKVDDAAIQKYYNEHKNEFENVSARHILIKFKGSPVPAREGKPELTEEQALAKVQDIKKQLANGANFDTIAKAESDDVGSGANGGDLGTFQHGQMVPAFDEAAFKLPVGQVSDPVKTQFGYHLIRVDKHETKSLADVKGDLEQKLRPEAARQAVEDLRKNTTVKLDDAYFGPEQPAAPAPGATPVPVTPPGSGK